MRIYFSLILLVFFTSCKSGKLHKKGKDLAEVAPITGEGKGSHSLNLKSLDFNEVKFKSDVNIKSKAISQGVPMTIHVKKDEVIWASVSIGLEIARAKITQDSLVFLDRFNRRAYIGTWEELSESANFELNFNILQSMLLGNMIFPILDNDKVVIEKEIASISQLRSGKDFESKINNIEGRLFEVKGYDPASKSSLEMSYKGFITEKQHLVPTLINLILKGQESAELSVKHTKVDFVESGLSFSFNVPSSYKILKLPGI